MTPAARLSAALAAMPGGAPRQLGVAVSGGGDSMALLVLAADWAKARGAGLQAISIDHGLRPEAAAECRLAAECAGALGVPHQVLRWQGWDRQGNLQAAARLARQRLIARLATDCGLRHVALAHTMEDQAETVLLRLARGSGVDGLAAMAPVRRDPETGLIWLRPLLEVRRADLREVLRARGIGWAEDPSNAELCFDRVKARALLSAPPVPGLDVPRLAETAERMSAAREVLSQAASDAARRIARLKLGAVGLDAEALAALPNDTRWRILAGALCLVSGAPLRPRLAALRQAEAAALAGRAASLHGCLVQPARGRLWVLREPAALRPGPAPGLWDRRWRIAGPEGTGLQVAALGASGLAQMEDWRGLGVPHPLALGLPGLWREGRLQAIPALPGQPVPVHGWTAAPLWEPAALSDKLISD